VLRLGAGRSLEKSQKPVGLSTARLCFLQKSAFTASVPDGKWPQSLPVDCASSSGHSVWSINAATSSRVSKSHAQEFTHAIISNNHGQRPRRTATQSAVRHFDTIHQSFLL
jgi:hypothetical protein